MGYKKGVYQSFALITQLGITMLVPIFLCILAADFLQDKFEINIFVPMIILGILAGGRNMYLLAKNANKDEVKEEDEDEEV